VPGTCNCRHDRIIIRKKGDKLLVAVGGLQKYRRLCLKLIPNDFLIPGMIVYRRNIVTMQWNPDITNPYIRKTPV